MKKIIALITVAFLNFFMLSDNYVHAETATDQVSAQSNYNATFKEYEKYSVGDVVIIDGIKFVITSREILNDSGNAQDYYVETSYVQVCEDDVSYVAGISTASSNITSYFSTSKSHTYTNGRTVTATALARFMYDGENCPTVYQAYYIMSDTSVLINAQMSESRSSLLKICTETLSYTWHTTLSDNEYSISVKCNKNGVQV